MNEIQRLTELLGWAVEGPAWHGPALRELLAGLPAETAAAHPIPGAHSIWELVLHATAWQEIVRQRLDGERTAGIADHESWPPAPEPTAEAWRVTLDELDAGHRRLADRLAAFPAERLDQPVRGRSHSVAAMLYGLLTHHLYHAGQIALLKRAAGVEPVAPVDGAAGGAP